MKRRASNTERKNMLTVSVVSSVIDGRKEEVQLKEDVTFIGAKPPP